MVRIAAVVALLAVLCALPAIIDHFLIPQPTRSPEEVRASQKRWGDEEDTADVAPYVVQYDDKTLADLKTRLLNWRPWHESAPMNHSTNWSYGTGSEYMKELVPYWADKYDWRAQETKLNKIGLKSTTVDGLRLVFQEVTNSKETAILLLHGWPGSIIEFHKMLPILASSNAQDYSIVVPCLPGYGFSSAPTVEGYNTVEMANTLHRLMAKLGYSNFIVHGGDWGGIIAQTMAWVNPDPVMGLHLNFFPSPPSPGYMLYHQAKIALFDDAHSQARAKASKDIGTVLKNTGYMHQQATAPETLGYALSDSPVGLAGWIIEKFQSWSDRDRFIEDKFSRDDLLTNVMIYWLTNSITSSMRLYKEFFATSEALAIGFQTVNVPVALSLFPHELFPPPDTLIFRKFRDVVYFGKHTRGGHFAAIEEPAALTGDLLRLVAVLRRKGA